MRGEDDDPQLVVAREQLGAELDAVVCPQLDVHDRQVGLQLVDQAPCRRGVVGLADALDVVEPVEREPSATARVWRFADGAGQIGFVNPVSEPFCGDCDRIRLTADGRLRTCLFSLHETDLRGPLRAGATDDDLEQIIRDAVWRKELKHHVNDPGFVQPERTMSAIGG